MTYPLRDGYVSLKLAAIVLVAFSSHARGQPLPDTASVQIINATSVPTIALKINERLVYENFPQGLKSAGSPTGVLKAIYEVEDRETGRSAKSTQITYQPGTHQSLIIFGDFSTDTPLGTLRHSGRAQMEEGKEYAPNILFQVFSHTATEAPIRLRIINGMPGKNLTFVARRREIVVEPGDFAVLVDQPAIAQYLARVDGEEIPLLMRQEGEVRNAMIIFFLRNGHPAFMRAFENQSNGKRVALER
jgi:hypothetical protein